MFFGPAAMIALVADRDHDAGLIVIPAVGGDTGAFAQFRTRAVSCHQQARFDHAAVGQRHVDAIAARIECCHRGGAQLDSFRLGALDQRVDQMPVFNHVREGLARFDISGKRQKHRTGRVLQFGIGDHHVEDGLRLSCDLVPHPDGFEQPAAGGDDGGRARIAAWP
jgi:hypothetical protein